jgi:hypothetical protein
VVGCKTCFFAICTTLFNGNITLLALPFGNIWVVGALGRLRVWVGGVFNENTAIGTHISELAVLANVNLVFGDVPDIFKISMF